MVAVEDETFHIPTCSIAIVSTRVSRAIFQVQKGIVSSTTATVQVVTILISKGELKNKASYIGFVEGQFHVDSIQFVFNGMSVLNCSINDPSVRACFDT